MYSRLNYVQSGHFISRVCSSGNVNATAMKFPVTQMVHSQKSSCRNALHGLRGSKPSKAVGWQSEAIGGNLYLLSEHVQQKGARGKPLTLRMKGSMKATGVEFTRRKIRSSKRSPRAHGTIIKSRNAAFTGKRIISLL